MAQRLFAERLSENQDLSLFLITGQTLSQNSAETIAQILMDQWTAMQTAHITVKYDKFLGSST